MPITYTYDRERDFILEQWTGRVDAAMLEAHWSGYMHTAAIRKCRRTIADVRDAHLDFTGQAMRELISRIVEPELHNQFWTTAIVVATPAQFGTARQYEVFAEAFSHNAIFEDVDAAIDWMLRQRKPPE